MPLVTNTAIPAPPPPQDLVAAGKQKKVSERTANAAYQALLKVSQAKPAVRKDGGQEAPAPSPAPSPARRK